MSLENILKWRSYYAHIIIKDGTVDMGMFIKLLDRSANMCFVRYSYIFGKMTFLPPTRSEILLTIFPILLVFFYVASKHC